MKMNKTTLEVLNTETGKVIKLGREERRLREKLAKAKNKPMTRVEINKLRTEHIYKIKMLMRPLDWFAEDLLDEIIYYVIEDGLDIPVILAEDGSGSSASNAFDICFEYCYQVLRYTKSNKAVSYHNEAVGMKIYLRAFCREGEEILKSEIIKFKNFLDKTREILYGINFDVATRVRDEFYKVTTPKTSKGEAFSINDLRNWLEDMGR
jgi:hypothetical protein